MAKTPSKEIQTKAAQFVQKKSSDWTTMSQNLRDKWLIFYELYRNFETKGRQPWQSKLFIPKAFEVVEKIAPRLTSHNPKFIAVPKKASATAYTSILQDYLGYIWDEERLKPKVRDWVKGMLIYGTGFVKIDWAQKTMVKKKQEEMIFEGEDMMADIEEESLVSEIPTLDLVDIFDILIDPRETDVQSALGLIHKMDNVLKADLDKDVYFNIDEIKDRDIDTDKTQKYEEQGIANMSNEEYVSIKEYWGLFQEKEGGEWKEKVIAIANDETLIRYEDNPFITENSPRGVRPFVAIKDQPIPGEFYAIGEIEPIVSLQVEINTLRNQRMDNVNLGINQIWRVDPDAGINPAQVLSRPGQLIFARPGEIEPMFNRDVPVSAYSEEQSINRDIQTASGTIDFTQDGGSQSFTNTATGERIRANEANSRYQYKLDNVEMGIAEVGNIMLHVASVFADDNIVIRKFTDEGEEQFFDINESIFDNVTEGVDIRVDAGSTGFDTIEDKRNNAIALGNISLQYANAGVPVNLAKNFMDILKFFPGIKNPQSHLQEQVSTEGQIQGQGQLPQPENQNPMQTAQPIGEIPPVNQNV
jgi:hypothetical protein